MKKVIDIYTYHQMRESGEFIDPNTEIEFCMDFKIQRQKEIDKSNIEIERKETRKSIEHKSDWNNFLMNRRPPGWMLRLNEPPI